MPFKPAVADDFVVEEIPAYTASGEGEHCFLLIEKRNLTTIEAVARLCAVLGVRPEDAGTAGLKDRVAVARQWVSLPGIDPSQVEEMILDNGVAPDDPARAYVRVVKAARHGNKLRTGHLRGNKFRITVRGRPDLDARLAEIAVRGLPNRYGGQRFARGNVETGRRLLGGESLRMDPQARRMAISSLQSLAFNEVVDERERQGVLRETIEGDLLEEGRVTGPMPGWKMDRPPTGTRARRLEDEVLARVGAPCETFVPLGKLGQGTRRALIVDVADATVERKEDAQVVRFRLPPGAYATLVMEALGCATD